MLHYNSTHVYTLHTLLNTSYLSLSIHILLLTSGGHVPVDGPGLDGGHQLQEEQPVR